MAGYPVWNQIAQQQANGMYDTSMLGGLSAITSAAPNKSVTNQAPTMIKAPTGAPPPGNVAPKVATQPQANNSGYLPASAWDPNKVGKLNNIWDYTQDRTSATGQALNPTEEMSPYVRFLENTQSGEDGMTRTQTWNELNWDALPNQGMTKFGKIGEQAVRVNNPEYLKDKSMMYFDPDYGWVTHKGNVDNGHNWLQNLGGNGAMIASLAMGGLMGAALPVGAIAGGVKAGFGALPGIAKGDWQSALANIVGSGLGSYYNIDPRLIAAGKTAAGYAMNGKG